MNSKLGDLQENRCPAGRRALLVLGGARSGTSVLTHILSALGASLPDQLLGAGQGNPLGHWEPAGLLKLNEEILRSVGRTWHDPRPISPNWFRSKAAYDFQERIREEIALSYGDASLMVIKEPRICRLAPLYLDALDVLGIEPLIILLIRHPAEVIRSVLGRDGGDTRTHELRWLRHLLEAEESSRFCRRVWTSFDRVLDNWSETAQLIAGALGFTWPIEPEKASREAANIVRTRHRHFRTTDDLVPFPLGILTTRAWQAALSALDGEESSARALFDEVRTAVSEVDRLSLPDQECLERRLGASEIDGRRLEELLAHSNSVGAEANARCDRLILECGELETQISQVRAELTERERKLEQLEELARQNSQLRAALTERENDRERLDQLAKQFLQVQEAFSGRERDRDRLEELVEQISKDRAAVFERESTCHRLVEQLRRELSDQVSQGAQLRRRMESMNSSTCWRLTWPIRWLHRQVNWIGSIAAKARP
jgi:hypothetical protein